MSRWRPTDKQDVQVAGAIIISDGWKDLDRRRHECRFQVAGDVEDFEVEGEGEEFLVTELDGDRHGLFAEVADDVGAGYIGELDVFDHDADSEGGHGKVGAFSFSGAD